MKLRILSDLHLDISDFSITPGDEDVLVLAGDMSESKEKFVSLIDQYTRDCQAKNLPNFIIVVLGNHDYYGSDLDSTDEYYYDLFNTEKYRRVIFLQNDYATINGFVFYGATLWTNIPKGDDLRIERSIMDYRRISDFTPDVCRSVHEMCVQGLEKVLKTFWDKKVVVITHHLPSFRSIDSRYKSSGINSAYATNLDELVAKKNVKLWIHGHTHMNQDYTLGDTRVLCNPRGYVDNGRAENENFREDFIVEI